MTQNQKITNKGLLSQLQDEYYMDCTFEVCDFSEQTLGYDTHFENCRFESCNFSLTVLQSHFSEIVFKDCKFTGSDFSGINKFSNALIFENSILTYAYFATANLKNVQFRNCQIKECDFTEANLSGAIFYKSTLTRSIFQHSNLQRANLETATDFQINPQENKIEKMIVNHTELHGLLSHLNIIIK